MDVIDLATEFPLWYTTPSPMRYPRQNHNAVILPDRSLLIVGGNLSGSDIGSVRIPELLDTDTMRWISNDLPGVPVYRNYHSTAILLPDARVWLGGGRVLDSGDVEDDTERRLSIFKPGYLMDGHRPIINSASREITYGDEFRITMDGTYPLDSIALMKPGAVTHGNNMDQRYIELDFRVDTGGPPPISYLVTAPSDANIAPPGYYMLFVLKNKSQSGTGESKIPSVAKFVKLMLES